MATLGLRVVLPKIWIPTSYGKLGFLALQWYAFWCLASRGRDCQIEIDASSCYLNNNTTNNVAEYNGLIIGLELALKHNTKNLIVKGDSQLVIKQMQKLYKVKAVHLIEYYDKANKLLMEFDTIEFIHVKRHLNARADELASLAIINK